MTRPIVRPQQLDLDSPGRRDYLVALEHDSIWGDHLIPLTVFVGPDVIAGQGLIAFGSNHGNEYEGPIALKGLLHEIDISAVRGRIIIVPVLNVSAFTSGTRESVADDGVNLNRAFVDHAGKMPALSGITYRIAAFVRDWIWPHVHVVLDIHSGGEVAKFSHVTSFHPVDDPEKSRIIEETARWFGTPFVMTYQNQTPGLLTSDAERLGKVVVGTELGYGCSVNIEGVRFAKQGVMAAAIHHHQLRGSIAPIAHHLAGTQQRVSIVDRACYSIAPLAGHFEPAIECGQSVRLGETLGWLHDFDRMDEKPLPLIAEIDGVVIAHAWINPVKRGQHIVVVARITD